jgi:hypothetical protein
VTPQEYAVRAVRAWVENVDHTTVPELRDVPTETFDLFIKQVLDAAQEMVGVYAFAVIAERQDEEWAHLQHAVDQGELEPVPYPVRFTAKGEVVQ